MPNPTKHPPNTFLVCFHAGPEIGHFSTLRSAETVGAQEAKHSGRRVNVYPIDGDSRTGERLAVFLGGAS